jgi:hypothetical protein
MFKPERIEPPSHKKNIDFKAKNDDDDDFIDYEEVD